MKALFSHVVWGEEYVSNFLQYSLPSQLSAGNLGVFDKNSVFIIGTLENNVKIFEESENIKRLKEIVSVRYQTLTQQKLDRSRHDSKYSILTYFQNRALHEARHFDIVFFGYADAIWADGSYKVALERIVEGYDAVFTPGYPVIDTMTKERLESARKVDTAALTLEKRDFARMVFECMHPMAKANIISDGRLSVAPSYLFWPVENQGLLMRAYHIHPVAFKVRLDQLDFFSPFKSTLDEEFVSRLSLYRGRIYVSPTSDEIAVCTLMENPEYCYFSEPFRSVSPAEVAIIAEGCAGMTHRELARYSVRLQYAGGDEKDWHQAENCAEQFMNAVMMQLCIPDVVLMHDSPLAFNARRERVALRESWVAKREDKVNEAIGAIDAIENHQPGIKILFVNLYAKKICLKLSSILYYTRLSKIFGIVLLPLIGRKGFGQIKDFVYKAGLPNSRRSNRDFEANSNRDFEANSNRDFEANSNRDFDKKLGITEDMRVWLLSNLKFIDVIRILLRTGP